MNRPSPFASKGFFKPAAHYLGSALSNNQINFTGRRRSLSLDDSDTEAGRAGIKGGGTMDEDEVPRTSYLTPHASTESSAAIPLVDISPSPSPSPLTRVRSAAQSEDDEDYDTGDGDQGRPLVASSQVSRGRFSAQEVLKRGGLGRFFYGTAVGWRLYLGLLVFWVGGCQLGLLLMNRFIFWTGTYKFPYPLTMTLIQLSITHLLLLALASLTRGLQAPLNKVGLGCIVAPPQAYSKGTRGTRYRGGSRHKSAWTNIVRWFTHGSGGISGGGLFEWQTQAVRHVLPVAIIFTFRIILSNISYAYAVLPMYMLSRILIIPLSLILTSVLLRQNHSVQTLSATLAATLNLLMAVIRPGERVSYESVLAGIFSSLFAALYPIALLRSYRQLVSDLVPQGDILVVTDDTLNSSSNNNTNNDLSSPDNTSVSTGTKEETRAYWRTLHYTSILTIAFLIPLVLLSGELRQIRRNCYFLDVPWFWFLALCGSLANFAVATTTLLLIKATSPLTANFVSVPRSAFQIAVLSKFRMPAHSWVGVGLCWACCLWYLLVRAREGRGRLFGIEAR
ncbi:hypothetical protein AAFC00_004202 [Neodothiora populina]|uniref:GDP-mannose transporter n=1 Tax=Neodothiora populina TaxID=2781224 RepID=A0ABR3PJ58_9PEZI